MLPGHLRAFIVILVLAMAVFALARRPACEVAIDEADWSRRRNLWFAVTAVTFLAHDFWLFIVLTGAIVLVAQRRESNATALFVWLMFAAPTYSAQVPGLGVFRQLLEIDHLRVLALVLLLPAALRLRAERGGWMAADALVAGYLLIRLALLWNVDTATNTARHATYALLDVVLPYYVASRSLRDMQRLRDVAMGLAVVAMVLAAIALFETARHWLLYTSLDKALEVRWSYGNYLHRSGTLRAQASTGQPIALGYVLSMALALFLYARLLVSDRLRGWLGLGLLVAGLVAALSRGPWIGAVVAVFVFRLAGPRAAGSLLNLVLGAAALAGLLLLSPLGGPLMEYLPFVGAIDQFNVAYRQQLMEVSLRLIAQNPWFGVADYYYKLADEDLVADGMVDVVNSYLGIALANGVVALAFFVGAFVVVMAGLWRAARRLTDPLDERRHLAAALLAALAGTLVTIGTTSSITVIPVVYWTLLGMAAGCTQMLRRDVAQAAQAAQDEAALAVTSPPREVPPRQAPA